MTGGLMENVQKMRKMWLRMYLYMCVCMYAYVFMCE